MKSSAILSVGFIFAAVVTAMPAAAEEQRTWQCEKDAIFHPTVRESVASISKKMRNIIHEHRERWDAAEMLRQCEAYAKGQPYEISCLNGRRDWKAIADALPSDLNQLSPTTRREYFLKLQEEDDGLKSAFAYCREVGATPKGDFSLKILKD